MELTQATFNVAEHLQKIIHPPLLFNRLTVGLEINCFFFKKKSLARFIWHVVKLFLMFWGIFSAIRIKILFRHWKENNNTEQLCFYTMVFGCMKFTEVVYDTLEFNTYELVFQLTQSLKLIKFRLPSSPIVSWRTPGLIEGLVYIFCLIFVLVFLIASCACPLLSYHPLKLISDWLQQHNTLISTNSSTFVLVERVFSGTYYFLIAAHVSVSSLFLLLNIVSFCDTMIVASSNLYDVAWCGRNHTGLFRDKQVISVKPSISFLETLKLYQCMQITIRVGNQGVAKFLQYVLLSGVLIASCSGCVCVNYYHEFHFPIYICASLLFPICVILDILLFTLAAILTENAVKFKNFWRYQLRRKEDRLRLSACPCLGFAFGFVEACRRKSALTVIDVYLNIIVTLTLVGSH